MAGVVPRFLIAGLAGYLVGEFMNSWVLVRMKAWTGEKHLWSRLLGSTVVGEFLRHLVASARSPRPPSASPARKQFLNYLILGFLWKTLVEIVIMPLSYALCAFLKRHEPYQQALLAG